MTDVEPDNRRRAEDFVREVEAALADLPVAERADLTAGLVDHLLEPGEDGRPLLDEQPEPREYAAELRISAVGVGIVPPRPPHVGKRRRRSPVAWGAAGLALLFVVAGGVALVGSLGMPDGDTSPSPTTSVSVTPAPVEVPDVTGLTQEEATQELLRVGLTIEFVTVADPLASGGEGGFVVETIPAPGELVEIGTGVELIIPAEG